MCIVEFVTILYVDLQMVNDGRLQVSVSGSDYITLVSSGLNDSYWHNITWRVMSDNPLPTILFYVNDTLSGQLIGQHLALYECKELRGYVGAKKAAQG